MELKPFIVTPRSMHELIIMPQFADVLDEAGNVLTPSTEDGDWTIMDDVVVSRTIIDVFGKTNILKRRDATCKLVYNSVGRMSDREVRTTKLYGAVEDCQDEFYQGAFEDWSNGNFQVFASYVMPMMDKAISTDMFCNKYFGDVTRSSDVNGLWSWNKFDGIFTQYFRYIANGTIPASQTFAIPEGELTADQAHDALDEAFQRQDGLFKLFPKADKAFYVDDDLADKYWEWVISAGQITKEDRMSGKAKLMFKGIEVKVKQWDPILAALNDGTAAHVVLLTLRSNWIYACDQKYGGGPNHDQAIKVFYDEKHDVWYRSIHLKSGTEIIAPQHTVLGITEF